MLEVVYGSISNGQILIENMCILVDIEMGAVIKYGDRDKTDIISYYDKTQEKLRSAGCDEMADNIQLIIFDRYGGSLSIEEICTIVNYGMNAHSKDFLKLFNMEENVLHDRIKRLQEYGY